MVSTESGFAESALTCFAPWLWQPKYSSRADSSKLFSNNDLFMLEYVLVVLDFQNIGARRKVFLVE